MTDHKRKNRIIFLTGPTAVGKTEIAACLAKKINAEIISCDSMQVYKGLEIISSQPSANLRKKIPHHLIAIAAPSKEYNVSDYRRSAIKKIKEIIGRGRIPLFVGGTGLYMSIVVDGIFNVKAQDSRLRKQLYKEAKMHGSNFLHQRLAKIDPEAAQKIHPNDTRRIVRALEVFEVTGKPISLLQKQRKGITDKYDVKIFCLDMPRSRLYKRIEARVDKMFQQGLVAEVKKLLGRRLSKTAAAAIGIRELKGYFTGAYDLNEARRQIIRNTCLYSKRQLTWFRKDKRIKWIKVGVKSGKSAVSYS
ncbi:MAG: tRNA (adenosine(37)-N6)-dimethylallyltransferase MiaA [Candidatus Omnitrophota bacterium]